MKVLCSIGTLKYRLNDNGVFCNENREKIPASTTARIESDHLGNDRSGVFNRRRGVVLISRQGSVFVNNSNKGADSETNGQDKKTHSEDREETGKWTREGIEVRKELIFRRCCMVWGKGQHRNIYFSVMKIKAHSRIHMTVKANI